MHSLLFKAAELCLFPLVSFSSVALWLCPRTALLKVPCRLLVNTWQPFADDVHRCRDDSGVYRTVPSHGLEPDTGEKQQQLNILKEPSATYIRDLFCRRQCASPDWRKGQRFSHALHHTPGGQYLDRSACFFFFLLIRASGIEHDYSTLCFG
jgi:hypothetical protein